MGKRSDYVRRERDTYFTPEAAVEPLIDHLPYGHFDYVEPCAGDGRLVKHIHKLTGGLGKCIFASDIEPKSLGVEANDALDLYFPEGVVDYVITNPPWERKFLHSFIEHWLEIAPMWLLFDADWAHTKQAAGYMTYCSKVVSVGRVKWIEGSKGVGKDNCCWYLFDGVSNSTAPTEFYGRMIVDNS